MSSFFLSQVLAGFAFATGLVAVQFKARGRVLLCLFVSTAFNGIHFLFLDRPEAGLLMFLTGIRYLVARRTTNRPVLIFFLLVNGGLFGATYQSPISLLALLGTMLGTYGSFQPAGRTVRLFFMGGNIFWLLHNSLVWTPVGIIMEVVFLASSVVGFWRYYGSPLKRATE
ncbi:MAG: YgjV family protein [Candidatus Latescibacteria bacterium]|nr:YgjV family protein [Candidatus Latescibacterota bacterium]